MTKLRNFFLKICPACVRRQRRTIRYAYPLLFISFALLGAAAITSNDSSFVRIESSVAAVRANDSFAVDVYAYAHEPVNAVDISLEFPIDQIEVLGIDTGESVITIWTQDPYVDKNTVHLSGGTYRRGFLGEHLIATINMRAKETGMAEFSASTVRLLAGDGTGSEVQTTSSVTSSGASIVIMDENADQTTLDAVASIKIVTDINGDGVVTLSDISAFMAAWFDRDQAYDFNGDGRMNFRDFSIILADSFTK